MNGRSFHTPVVLKTFPDFGGSKLLWERGFDKDKENED